MVWLSRLYVTKLEQSKFFKHNEVKHVRPKTKHWNKKNDVLAYYSIRVEQLSPLATV